jgi:A/G-specific adenine glycosylase
MRAKPAKPVRVSTRRRGPAPAPTAVAGALDAWFPDHARALPWRTSTVGRPIGGPRDPYLALVAEAMLQQTQVSRVVPAYEAFVARFPTVRNLAEAKIDDVLALWRGLGYYRRARNLHGAAREIVARFQGVVPRDVDVLRSLPGVGRYTAGAVASIAMGERAPIVDGNVRRVLLRLHGRQIAEAERSTDAWAWSEAQALVDAAARPGVLNEGLMELGATICVPPPASARCEVCPLAKLCVARRQATQDRIPAPKARTPARGVTLDALIALDAHARVLIVRRPARGLWAGQWFVPTLDRGGDDNDAPLQAWASALGVRSLRKLGEVEHATTHRRVRFVLWLGTVRQQRPRPATAAHNNARNDAHHDALKDASGERWVALDEARSTSVSSALAKVLALAPSPGAGSR